MLAGKVSAITHVLKIHEALKNTRQTWKKVSANNLKIEWKFENFTWKQFLPLYTHSVLFEMGVLTSNAFSKHSVVDLEILSHFLYKKFVKTTVLLKKLLESRFQWEKLWFFRIFAKEVTRTISRNSFVFLDWGPQ